MTFVRTLLFLLITLAAHATDVQPTHSFYQIGKRLMCSASLGAFLTGDEPVTQLGQRASDIKKPRFVSRELAYFRWVVGGLINERQGIRYQLSRDETMKTRLAKLEKNRDSLQPFERFDLERYKFIPEEDKILMRNAIDEYEGIEKEIRRFLRIVERKDRDALLAMVRERSQNPRWPAWKDTADEYLLTRGILSEVATHAVTLLSGPPVKQGETVAADELTSIRALWLARELGHMGYVVLYDADSTLGSHIATVVGKNALGISAHKSEPGIVQIKNDFLRMQVFEGTKRVVVTQDSITGAALLIRGEVHAILDPKGIWDDSLGKWAKTLKEKGPILGLTNDHIPSASGVEDILRLESGKGRWVGEKVFTDRSKDFLLPRNLGTTIPEYDMLDRSTLEEVMDYTTAIFEAEDAHDNRQGAVYFGSGKMEKTLVHKIYDAAERLSTLRIPAITGGAGGFMQVVNTAAFGAGAPSIGIPIAGSKMIATETKFPVDVHTNTFFVTDYASRIPLLLGERQLLVVLPGGAGTMKELAVSFMRLAARQDSQTEIILFDRAYYEPLMDWILRLPIPDYVKNRITLVDGSADLEATVRRLIREKRLIGKTMRTHSRLKPNTLTEEQLKFLKEEEEEEDED